MATRGNDDDDDVLVVRRPKRQREKENPLARAREVVSSSSVSRRDSKTALLWHRRSGIGYRLFLEYYAAQPTTTTTGTAVGVDVDVDNNKHNSNNTNNNGAAGGAGLSRASKRRKKKKGKAAAVVVVAASSSPVDHTASIQKQRASKTTTNPPPSVLEKYRQHRLWQAFEDSSMSSSSSSWRHLEPLVAALVQPLPLTFRIRRGLDSAREKALLGEMHTHNFDELLVSPYGASEGIFQAKPYHAVSNPHVLCKKTLAHQSPALHRWLHENSCNGNLARQELGSMLPVVGVANLLLDNTTTTFSSVQSKRVLDLCASPGSKTLQAWERVSPWGGKVKANDVNPDRLETLREAVARSGVPNTDRIKFTRRDASLYPLPQKSSSSSAQHHHYRVVLCDVPCSGDGTVRKDPHILPLWQPSIGNALHRLQLRILIRALQCVAVGGCVVYSTCSLNPVENEAVVAAALRHVRKQQQRKQQPKKGQEQLQNDDDSATTEQQQQHTGIEVELVPWPAEALPGLRYRPGMTRWVVADYPLDSKRATENTANGASNNNNNTNNEEDGESSLVFYSSYDEARAAGMQSAVPTLWPVSGTAATAESSSSLSSDHPDDPELLQCLRLWPQDNDSGGFFVTLLKRTA